MASIRFLLARSDDDFGPWVVGALVLIVIGIIVALKIREWVRPRQARHRLMRFFGRRLRDVIAHDKQFPGYDLGSVNRAIDSLLNELCEDFTRLGGLPISGGLSDLLHAQAQKMVLGEPQYQRVAIDVDDDESFISNCMWTARIGASLAAGTADNRIAVRLSLGTSYRNSHHFFDDSSDSVAGPTINISIACRSKEMAGRIFRELDQRRRRLNLYRGKVVAPVINEAGVQSLGFARLRAVADNELILPEAVKKIIDGSILSFYRNRTALLAAGVEMKRGILLHSPPGTGKTTVALYLAGLLPDFTVCFVSGRQLLHPRELCLMARYLRPTLLVLEDIDLIAQDRDANGLATILGELMNQIDGCEPDEEVIFLMNTNSLDRLEQAVRDRPGRVDQIIQIPLPDEASRRKLIKLFGRQLDLTSEAVDRFAVASSGATPATIKEVIKRAAVLSVQRDYVPADPSAAPVPSAAPKVRADDLLLAYEQVGRARAS